MRTKRRVSSNLLCGQGFVCRSTQRILSWSKAGQVPMEPERKIWSFCCSSSVGRARVYVMYLRTICQTTLRPVQPAEQQIRISVDCLLAITLSTHKFRNRSMECWSDGQVKVDRFASRIVLLQEFSYTFLKHNHWKPLREFQNWQNHRRSTWRNIGRPSWRTSGRICLSI